MTFQNKFFVIFGLVFISTENYIDNLNELYLNHAP